MENKIEKAIFAAGCFWGIESAFRKIKGVKDVVVGYTGGSKENPIYEEVSSGKTGHAEAVEVSFDPNEVSYRKLLEEFWNMHDPTTKDMQGADIGNQYRSTVFFNNKEQENAAKELKEELNKSGKFKNEIVTEITEATEFYKAEEYHQRYVEKNGGGGLCHL